VSKNDEAPAFYVLDEDKQWAHEQIAKIEQAIQNMGPEFNVALNESNETWHDNAPFDALRDEQALLVADMQNLKEILFKAALTVPKARAGHVGIGHRVSVEQNGKTHHYFLAGHWARRIGHVYGGALVISCVSPLGQVLLGAKVGDTVTVPTNKRELRILAID
jgi:transcription elongation GreA/GreB family factor